MYRLMKPERNWHMILLMGFAALNGIVGLIPSVPSSAVETAFPGWLRYLWYVGLIVGGLGGICGYLMGFVTQSADGADSKVIVHLLSRMVNGMIIERAAMWLLTGLGGSYVLGALAVSGDRVLVALGIFAVVAFSAANVARARQLRRTLRRVHDRLDEALGGQRR